MEESCESLMIIKVKRDWNGELRGIPALVSQEYPINRTKCDPVTICHGQQLYQGATMSAWGGVEYPTILVVAWLRGSTPRNSMSCTTGAATSKHFASFHGQTFSR